MPVLLVLDSPDDDLRRCFPGTQPGHSDRRQLVNYLTHLIPKPERIFVVHGEKQKTMNFANFMDNKVGINTIVPAILETFRLL